MQVTKPQFIKALVAQNLAWNNAHGQGNRACRRAANRLSIQNLADLAESGDNSPSAKVLLRGGAMLFGLRNYMGNFPSI